MPKVAATTGTREVTAASMSAGAHTHATTLIRGAVSTMSARRCCMCGGMQSTPLAISRDGSTHAAACSATLTNSRGSVLGVHTRMPAATAAPCSALCVKGEYRVCVSHNKHRTTPFCA